MRFRRLVALSASLAIVVAAAPSTAARTARTQTAAAPQAVVQSGVKFTGTVRRNGQAVANVRLQLRNVDTRAIAGETVSDANGAFSFSVPEPGLYVVEALNDDGGIIAAGNLTQVTTSAVASDVILPSIVAAAFWTSTAAIILYTAGGAGILAWVAGSDGNTDSGGGSASQNTLSPER